MDVRRLMLSCMKGVTLAAGRFGSVEQANMRGGWCPSCVTVGHEEHVSLNKTRLTEDYCRGCKQARMRTKRVHSQGSEDGR